MNNRFVNIIRKIPNSNYSLFGKYKKNFIQELIYAQVFHDSIKGCDWLDDSKFAISPGRYAVGYNYMYVAFRVLNEIKPQNILEFGMGHSTKLIAEYVNNCHKGGVYHACIEENEQWADVFKRNFNVTNSDIRVIDTHLEHYPNERYPKVNRFNQDKLRDVVKNHKFDFISIDGPVGSNGNSKAFSRSDIIEYLPECLSNRFVILMDDYERDEERNTSKAIRQILTKNNIKWEYGLYLGESMVNIICSKDLAYLCSL